MEGICHVSTIKTIVQYLLEVAEKEIFHGHKASIVQWKGHAKEFKAIFLEEVKKYAHGHYPFNQQIDEQTATITWWKQLEGNEFAQILPVLAIKIFAVCVNSMPEERTVSAFTWINPALWQHYTMEKKAHKHTTPRPTVRFYGVKGKIFNSKASTKKTDKVLDDEDDSWLNEPCEEIPPAWALDAETTSPIDATSKLLATFLADEKDHSMGSKSSENLMVLTTVNAAQNGQQVILNDNDFSMEFQ
ncbi:hypothetical protein BYT27DRAFT_7222703 [Phlegmacium glaucopus]|nr:hypothetical protein BYT27DRAFT_7222703 [Phlegmacium glaucopus]